jgi:hypothetical protein
MLNKERDVQGCVTERVEKLGLEEIPRGIWSHKRNDDKGTYR